MVLSAKSLFAGEHGVANALCAIAIFCILLQGCGRKPEGKRDLAPDPDVDLILELGEGIDIGFVFIEELNLFVGAFEVNNAQYRRFRPEHTSGKYRELSLDRDDQPVVNVSWQDALSFCEWLNNEFGVAENTKYLFRLPTVAEWETYAACGDHRQFPWGNDWPPPENLNYYGSENPGPGARLKTSDGHKISCRVEKSGMNEWRLFGVGGNVWEWCQDAGDAEGKTRVLKGASWVDSHPLFLAIGRNRIYEPDYRAVNMGFRVVAEATEATPEEIEAFAARKVAEEAKRKAEIESRAAEESRVAEEQKKRNAETMLEGQAKARGEIRSLLRDKELGLVSYLLDEYSRDFGKDDFYDEISSLVANTRVIKLSEGVFVELLLISDLNCWVGKYEITNKQFRRFRPEHRVEAFRGHELDGDGQPAVNVSWLDAKEFCDWLSEEFADSLPQGSEFRLPTEREWETFAACGSSRDFPWGSEWPPLYGNFGSIEDYDDGFPVTCPVDESGMSEWGLFGIAGNVWEWCEDADPDETDSSNGEDLSVRRVLKGGAWNLSRADALRLSNRISDAPDRKNMYIGFRIVMDAAVDMSK